jgi:hypothetical protein
MNTTQARPLFAPGDDALRTLGWLWPGLNQY